ncbi:ras association domain-containing protein 1 isoform X2 [Eurytemora carolleeae]|uniref:ras association domain-containing protein 1 isoform X2 n=1 Tax=Eurytemora carolleeae TaxID=1294199 RepID=UPI000C77F58B|nr:ras association domain-containing protein 1 isoform X2 [Eurytemora carolleeae]XP_023336046.1 ras association domain-containing protein 1 isoform X2 [Eurytemora carolleeae]XP_023336047.1 ras association domain-containing protein 1 isoform X2 [Eurytemora carolleeae]|eukprot:XP_023336045.1 ras association domain-containing protein 1-like isoform X2 [Eurytemora affinis]
MNNLAEKSHSSQRTSKMCAPWTKRSSVNHNTSTKVKFEGNRFSGGIRVYFSLRNSVSMISEIQIEDRREILATKFTFKNLSSEVLQVKSNTTAEQVVFHIYRQFRMRDELEKFALFERKDCEQGTNFRKLDDFEKPLQLSLQWMKDFARKKLVFMDINPSIYNKDSTISTDEMEADKTLLQHIAELDQAEKAAEDEIKERFEKYKEALQKQYNTFYT